MSPPVVRSADRPAVERPPALPTLQRLVDRAAGSAAMTVLVNEFVGDQAVPVHVHEVEEVLVVTTGTCSFSVGDDTVVAAAGDAVIVPPHTLHAISHAGPNRARVVAILASADALPADLAEHG